MIDLASIRLGFGDRTLFDDLSFRVGERDRVALVGPNGSGKTTLLRMMFGEVAPDTGQVARGRATAIGYLPQDGVVHRGRSIQAEARAVFEDLLDWKREADSLEERMARGEADEQAMVRYHEAVEQFAHRGGYEIESRVASVLDGLGFERSEWDGDVATLSGGWQMRLALAKLLIRRPEVLLLDEPTNHLDLLASNWLEEFLGSYAGSFVLVSHDRHFLDNVVTHVAELRFGKVRLWTGNYTRYLASSAAEKERLQEQKRRQDEEIEKMERFINRFRAQPTKARQVQSRIRMLEKIERIELPFQEASVHFRFPPPPRSGRTALELRGIRKAYGEKVVFSGCDLTLERGDRLALVGPNGAGKSTLMRILAGREPFEGERKTGHNVSLAFFAQDEAMTLDPRASVHDEVAKVAPMNVFPHLRTLLGSFLFHGDDVFKPCGVLSGGERMRVALAKMLLEPRNLLVLDEPTNHLDLSSKEVLIRALLDFPGTIVLVSHDRYVIDRLATRIGDVGGGRVEIYPGDYEDFLSYRARRLDLAAVPVTPMTPAGPSPARPQASKDEREARKEAARLERQVARRRGALEKEIERIEGKLRALEARMNEPGFFAGPESRVEVEQHEKLRKEAEHLYEEWSRLV